jgi:low affinity Fe/Cu permease
MSISEVFRKFVAKVSKFVGLSWTFIAALLIVASWIAVGLANGFTDSWLLLMNTVCSVTTFLVVFIVQNAQNRHTRIMQLKLDELIKAQRAARNDLIGMEEFTDQEIDELQRDFQELSKEFFARRHEIIHEHLQKRPEKQ